MDTSNDVTLVSYKLGVESVSVRFRRDLDTKDKNDKKLVEDKDYTFTYAYSYDNSKSLDKYLRNEEAHIHEGVPVYFQCNGSSRGIQPEQFTQLHDLLDHPTRLTLKSCNALVSNCPCIVIRCHSKVSREQSLIG